MPRASFEMAIGFLAGGLVLVVFGVVTLLRDRVRRRQWQAFPGRVVASRLDDGHFRAMVTYVRDGREVSFWNPFTSTSFTDPVGREVKVLVNPEDPSEAVVGRGLAGGLAFGLALIAIGVVLLMSGADLLSYAPPS